MAFETWIAFALASLVIALVPGPGVASIVGFAFSSGRRTALASVAGMALGNAIAISASLAGAGVILAASALAFTTLKWIGAAYLIGIGLLAIVNAGRVNHQNAERFARAISPRAAFLTNVAVGTFHPKTILFFVAFASQFINPDQAFLHQAAILTATFTLIAASTDTIYALTASQVSGLLKGRQLRAWLARLGGGALIAAGLATAALRRA